jgi:hypothetical protein
MLWIRIDADPDPAFYLNADPDPGSRTNPATDLWSDLIFSAVLLIRIDFMISCGSGSGFLPR